MHTDDIPALLAYAKALNFERELDRIRDGSYYADMGIPTSRGT
jgi:hypothetical protein